MLNYLRYRQRLTQSSGHKTNGLPNTNTLMQRALPTPIIQAKPVQQIKAKDIPSVQEVQTERGLPQEAGLPNTPGLPDIKLLPQGCGLPGSHSKEFNKKKATSWVIL